VLGQLQQPIGQEVVLTSEECQKVFFSYDKDKSGRLDRKESRLFFLDLISILEKQGGWPFKGYEDEAINEAFERLDKDKNGTISLDELTQNQLVLWDEDQEKRWRISSAFELVDADRSGTIDREEMRKWMEAAIGVAETLKKIKENEQEYTALDLAFRNADSDKSGSITKKEFLEYFSRTNLPTIVSICEASKKIRPSAKK